MVEPKGVAYGTAPGLIDIEAPMRSEVNKSAQTECITGVGEKKDKVERQICIFFGEEIVNLAHLAITNLVLASFYTPCAVLPMNCLGRLPIWDVKTPRNAVFYIEIFAKGLQNSRNAQILVIRG